MPKKTRSASQKSFFSTYSHKAEKNRKARQARHLKAHPNDEQAKKAGSGYRRQRPAKKGNWFTRDQEIQFKEEFKGLSITLRNKETINLLENMSRADRKVFIKQLADTRRSRRDQSFQQLNLSKKKKNIGYAYE